MKKIIKNTHALACEHALEQKEPHALALARLGDVEIENAERSNLMDRTLARAAPHEELLHPHFDEAQRLLTAACKVAAVSGAD